MSNTTPPTTAPNPTPGAEPWTTRSRKEMFLGLIIVIAGIGSQPFFLALSPAADLIALLFILIGVYVAVLGYLQQH